MMVVVVICYCPSKTVPSILFKPEFYRARVVLEQLPFILPFQLRVNTFRQFIKRDKEAEGLDRDDAPSQHIIIKRSRLVEDGFQMLSPFTARELRQTIRVKFYNDLGTVK